VPAGAGGTAPSRDDQLPDATGRSASGTGVGAGSAVESLSFRDASAELDAIVAGFEHGDVDVDQLVVQLQRATAIVEELDRRLRATQAQVDELVPRLTAVARGRTTSQDADDEEPEPDGRPSARARRSEAATDDDRLS
jgi:exodeoxyribonuclease VII small subunit